MRTPKTGFADYSMSPDLLDGEVFKVIPNGNGLEASNKGRIRKANGKIVPVGDNGTDMKNGYFRIGIKTDCNERLVHRLVHLAWFGEIPKDYNGRTCIVDHMDGNRHNNCIENLGVMDNRRNLQIAASRGAFKGKSTRRTPIVATDIETGSTFHFESQAEAERILKIPNASINKALRGERASSHGYIFTYDDSMRNAEICNQMTIFDYEGVI